MKTTAALPGMYRLVDHRPRRLAAYSLQLQDPDALDVVHSHMQHGSYHIVSKAHSHARAHANKSFRYFHYDYRFLYFPHSVLLEK